MSDERSIVRVDHAHKYYSKGRSNEIHVMNDIDLSLPSSGMVAVFGQSGCGKTTLLNTVGGLDRINSGRISIFGEDLSKNTDTIRNKYIGFIFQNYNLNVSETVLENVGDALRLCGLTNEDEIRERSLLALRNVEMEKYRDRTPDTLSGGQQQRVAIARAIVKSPAIILADEPTGNLDENNTVKVMDILKEISRTRLVLLVTHEANLVDYYCDQVIEMSDGQILNVRENTGANGYIQRNKNDIWLGELEKREESVPGLDVTCYGNIPADAPVKVRLICEKGRLFLKCDTPGVKLLDDSSEITLREGVFNAARNEARDDVKHEASHVDMSGLGPVNGTVFGKLFHFGNSLKLAWRENFSKKKKKGRAFLSFCLAALAVVVVFMTAVFAVEIRDYRELVRDHDKNLFTVPVVMDKDGTCRYDYNGLIRDQLGQHGMDSAHFISYGLSNAKQRVSFDTAAFMTAEAPTLESEAYLFRRSVADSMQLLAGSLPADGTSDVLITSGLADRLLENSKVSYINSYDDLIGLVTTEEMSGYRRNVLGGRLCISGIVKSDEQAVFLDDLRLASSVLDNDWGISMTFISQSMYQAYSGEIKPGEAVSVTENMPVGYKVLLLGDSFTVKDKITAYYDPSEYPLYWKDRTGEAPMNATEYLQSKGLDGSDEGAVTAWWEWLFDYYPTYLKDFLQTSGMHNDDLELWMYVEKDFMPAYLVSMMYKSGFGANEVYGGIGYDESKYDMIDRAYAAWLYRELNGEWPQEDYSDDSIHVIELLDQTSVKYEMEFWNTEIYKRYYQLILNDDDYIRLTASVGATDPNFGEVEYHFGYDESWDGEIYYHTYMMIHADDPTAADTYLKGIFGDDLISPDDTLREMTSLSRQGVITAIVSVTVVVALMCLCVFFMMRSSFMSRVKEVGILRAIGVKKSNLLFRFLIETVMLTLITVGLGYVLAWMLEAYMQGGVILSSVFFFPVWIAVPLFVLLLAVCVLFGLLPAMLLLRRTPSEILSKYDI